MDENQGGNVDTFNGQHENEIDEVTYEASINMLASIYLK